ncbi:glycosyltransferase family protein [Streptomyces prasinus]|uniref:Moenomycin biosynthesis protein MoeGT1 n=1 Tax=Streptomyces prasinus TaxID=67345 RepID=UPI0006EB97F9|nr:Moenomycin biosynthesis protein MoeGT1 [Streptomyces prasinus]
MDAPDRPRVQVLSPRTWGEFGNYLAATRFSRALRSVIDAEVTLLEAEPILPWIGEAGAEIRTISLESPDAVVRNQRYMALMDRLQARFPEGFEVDPTPAQRADLEPLTRHLRRTAPDVVVGTKGFVARLCVAAVRLAGTSTRVVSHVTNPGLLQLPLHRSRYPDLTLVGFPRAKEHLLATAGGDPERVRVVGPLVAQHDLRDFMTSESATSDAGPWGDGPGPDRPRVIIFSNRGGETYPELVRRLAGRHPGIDLVFVGYGDPELARRTAAAGLPHWRFHSVLSQTEYFDYIRRASRSRYGLLVSKAGPNTTLEAAFFGIPVLMLESGLPMEQWVPGLIDEEGLGRACATPEELFKTADDWLTRPSVIEVHKKAAVSFAESVLDQDAVTGRIGAALRALLDAR